MFRRILISVGIGIIIILFFMIAIGQGKIFGQKNRGSFKARSLYGTAINLQSKGNLQEAVKLYQELTEKFPQDQNAAGAWYELGKIYEKDNKHKEAKTAYLRVIANFPNYEQIAQVESRLWDVNIKILFSPTLEGKDITYKVEPKDMLIKIAEKYNTTVDLIMRSNNLKSNLIRPGDRLKISTNKYSVIVDKSQNSLTLKADDEIFKVYSVATGKYNCTPVGNFKIVEKLKNPDWYKGGEGIIPASSPENILGTRWLGLSEPQYGIHGGAKTEDLGKHITNGCVRMLNADVEELFTILPRGTEVTIVD